MASADGPVSWHEAAPLFGRAPRGKPRRKYMFREAVPALARRPAPTRSVRREQRDEGVDILDAQAAASRTVMSRSADPWPRRRGLGGRRGSTARRGKKRDLGRVEARLDGAGEDGLERGGPRPRPGRAKSSPRAADGAPGASAGTAAAVSAALGRTGTGTAAPRRAPGAGGTACGWRSRHAAQLALGGLEGGRLVERDGEQEAHGRRLVLEEAVGRWRRPRRPRRPGPAGPGASGSTALRKRGLSSERAAARRPRPRRRRPSRRWDLAAEGQGDETAVADGRGVRARGVAHLQAALEMRPWPSRAPRGHWRPWPARRRGSVKPG